MTIIDEPLLAQFRLIRFCEACGRPLRYRGEPHHVHPRGMGGGSRLDIRINIILLGGPWDCACHRKTEDGKPPLKSELRKKIAAREHCTVAFIVEETARLLQLPKGADPGRLYPAARFADRQAELLLRTAQARSQRGLDCLETFEGW